MSIEFISYSTSEILELFKTAYYEQHGKPMIIGSDEFSASAAFAYVLGVLCGDFNHSSEQRFIDTATGEFLDAIAHVNGIERQTSTRSSSVFSLTRAGSGTVAANVGEIRIKDSGGHVFENIEPVYLNSSTVSVLLYSTESGSKHNGIPANAIHIIESGLNYISAGTNTEATSGGTDGFAYSEEGDAEFREYIKLNRSAYVVGGSASAYKAKAFNTDSRIIDVRVLKDGDSGYERGKVKIYLNYPNGTSDALKTLVNNKVLNACNADDFKPIGDLVQVYSAEILEIQTFASNIIVKYPLKFRNSAISHYQRVMREYNDYISEKFGRPASESELVKRFLTQDDRGICALSFELKYIDAFLYYGNPNQILKIFWYDKGQTKTVDEYVSAGVFSFIDTGE